MTDTILDKTLFYLGLACIGLGLICIGSALPTPTDSQLHDAPNTQKLVSP